MPGQGEYSYFKTLCLYPPRAEDHLPEEFLYIEVSPSFPDFFLDNLPSIGVNVLLIIFNGIFSPA